jgi:hypothetical protein
LGAHLHPIACCFIDLRKNSGRLIPNLRRTHHNNFPYGESDRDAVEKLKYHLYYIWHYSQSSCDRRAEHSGGHTFWQTALPAGSGLEIGDRKVDALGELEERMPPVTVDFLHRNCLRFLA